MILIVEDLEEIRELLAAQLTACGYGPIIKAGSAEEALATLDVSRTEGEECPIDIVLMDIMLPVMDGITATCLIKENPRLADVPVIMVSSLEDEESLNQAFIAGAFDYVVKPATMVALRARVQSALRWRTEARRRRAREGELAELSSDRRQVPAADPGGVQGLGWPDPIQCGQLLAERSLRHHAGAVLFAAIDDFGRLEELDGADPAAAMTRRIMELAASLPGRIGDVLAMAGDGRLAVLFESSDANVARDLAGKLVELVGRARIPHPRSNAGPYVSLSVGYGAGLDAAVIARRALDHARAHGGARIIDGATLPPEED
ncbi:response regulator [Niveispirillum sp. KHB5.9]|uniref:response regulator n=1 Tax=Niveispirillum sp. KHB5.9 TaxID=3400269 RepID=UPI003A854283